MFYGAFVENAGPDRGNAVRPTNQSVPSMPPPQPSAPPRPPPAPAPAAANNHRPTVVAPAKKHEQIHRATSPVDERILNEFYADAPKDLHQYTLEGRQYYVHEGANLTDIETYRKGK